MCLNRTLFFLLLMLLPLDFFSAEAQFKQFTRRLSKPLIGDDGRIYACSENYFYAFESNGSIAWMLHLNYSCDSGLPPIHGGRGKIYLIAENRVLKINFSSRGTLEPAAEVFFGSESDAVGQEIVGVSVSTLSSSVFINIRNRGLFAYSTNKQLLWSAGPVLYQFGYRQGCRRNDTDCFFTSVPMLDQCEASIYISNSEGELYSLPIRSPHFKWIQDLSPFDKSFTITSGNNGRVYITVPTKALLLALDVNTGNILWQGSIGPLSSPECAPVVDSNGWVSIGSLDGFLYSFSPTGLCKKFSKVSNTDSVIQVGPLLHCSGFAVYISQTQMENKISRIIDGYNYVSVTNPIRVTFTMLVPATGSAYWSESHPGPFTSLLSSSDLSHFLLDEKIILAFLATSNVKTEKPLQCRSRRQKILTSCSLANPKKISIYTGSDKAVLLFLLFESIVLMLLAAAVRFCCIFWRKEKLKDQSLGSFLEKRRSLQLEKKTLETTLTELEKQAAEEAHAHEVIERLGNAASRKEQIEKRLSTTYSLGRDQAVSTSKSLLPLRDGKARSYSFQNSKKESVTIFHTLSSDSSSSESSGGRETSDTFHEDSECEDAKMKSKRSVEGDNSSSDDERTLNINFWRTSSASMPRLEGCMNSMIEEQEIRKMDSHDEAENGTEEVWLKKRRALSSTN